MILAKIAGSSPPATDTTAITLIHILFSGFRKLPISDQITLVQTSLYQLCIFMHVDLYDPVKRKINYFNFSEDELQVIMKTFPNFSVFADHFLYFGETLQELGLDDMEYGFLSAIQLMSSGE
jgi:hypothetical protein